MPAGTSCSDRKKEMRRTAWWIGLVGGLAPFLGFITGLAAYIVVGVLTDPREEQGLLQKISLGLVLFSGMGVPPGLLVLAAVGSENEKREKFTRRRRVAAVGWIAFCVFAPFCMFYLYPKPADPSVLRTAGLRFSDFTALQFVALFVCGAGLAGTLAAFMSSRAAAFDRKTGAIALIGGAMLLVAALPLVAIYAYGVLLIAVTATPLAALWLKIVFHLGAAANPAPEET